MFLPLISASASVFAFGLSLGSSFGFGLRLVAPIGFLILVAVALSSVTIVKAHQTAALTVFGRYRGHLDPGLHVVPPVFSRTYPIEMRTQTHRTPELEAVNREKTRFIAVVKTAFTVSDPETVFFEVEDYQKQLSAHIQTTVCTVLSETEYEANERPAADLLAAEIQAHLEEQAADWGIEIIDTEFETLESE